MTRSVFDSQGLYCGFAVSNTVQTGSVGSYAYRRIWQVSVWCEPEKGLQGQFSDSPEGIREALAYCIDRATIAKKNAYPKVPPKQTLLKL